jgi:hypothetical protein
MHMLSLLSLIAVFISIVLEFAKESRPRERPEFDRSVTAWDTLPPVAHIVSRGPRTRRPTGFRITVGGISRDTSWQVRSFVLGTWSWPLDWKAWFLPVE